MLDYFDQVMEQLKNAEKTFSNLIAYFDAVNAKVFKNLKKKSEKNKAKRELGNRNEERTLMLPPVGKLW